MKVECAVSDGFLSIDRLLDKYLEHLRTSRDLTEGSIERHRRCTSRFLEHFGHAGRLWARAKLNVVSVQAYVSAYAKGHGHAANRDMFSTLRVFLGYLHIEGHLPNDLSAGVPSIKCRRLSHVPRGISDDDIDRLLGSIDRSKDIGRRDYAMILMLSTYGVRGVQIRRLKLDDVRWSENQIVFHPAKGGKRIIQHLSVAVGNSLIDYLRESPRQHTACREVFLNCTGIPRPLSRPANLSAIVNRRLRSAGIELPEGVSRGSHSFRHAFARRMVCGSEPFKHVADMLGHKTLNSTMIYTKIDFPSMRQATLEWPEVHS